MRQIKPRILIIVPMKDPLAAKTRLSGVVSAVNRRTLAKALFSRTLELLNSIKAADSEALVDFAVVTRSDEIEREATLKGAIVIKETSSNDLCAALQTAANWAQAHKYRAICILPADLIAPDPTEIRALIDRAGSDPCVIISPSDDYGTNALLVSPPTAIPFCYGKRSSSKHYLAAKERCIQPVVMPLESLRYDLDASSDLDYLIQVIPELESLTRCECLDQ